MIILDQSSWWEAITSSCKWLLRTGLLIRSLKRTVPLLATVKRTAVQIGETTVGKTPRSLLPPILREREKSPQTWLWEAEELSRCPSRIKEIVEVFPSRMGVGRAVGVTPWPTPPLLPLNEGKPSRRRLLPPVVLTTVVVMGTRSSPCRPDETLLAVTSGEIAVPDTPSNRRSALSLVGEVIWLGDLAFSLIVPPPPLRSPSR